MRYLLLQQRNGPARSRAAEELQSVLPQHGEPAPLLPASGAFPVQVRIAVPASSASRESLAVCRLAVCPALLGSRAVPSGATTATSALCLMNSGAR